SEEHTSELQSPCKLVCRLLLEKKKSVPDLWTPGGGHQLLLRKIVPRPPGLPPYVTPNLAHGPVDVDYLVYDVESRRVVASLHGHITPWASPQGVVPFVSGTRVNVLSRPFFFNDPPPTDIYTLSLHDALPIFLNDVSGILLVARQAVGQRVYVGMGGPDQFFEGRDIAALGRCDQHSFLVCTSHYLSDLTRR